MSRQEDLSRDFERRVRPHGPVLVRYLRRLLRDPEESPDVLQSALLKALTAHARFDPEKSFRAWLFRFVTLEAWSANRRAARERRAEKAGAAAEPVADPSRQLEEELTYEELLENPDRVLARLDAPLAATLRDLAAKERAAFLLRALADLTCAEIAGILEAPKGTVLSWLFRARAKLRLQLAAYASEHDLGSRREEAR